jgi:hypothetical protein
MKGKEEKNGTKREKPDPRAEVRFFQEKREKR